MTHAEQPGLSAQLESVEVEVPTESTPPGQQESCMLICNKDLTVEVRRPSNTCDKICCNGCKHCCSNLQWWFLACLFNTLACPIVMLWHSVRLFLLRCCAIYAHTTCCKICSCICCECCWLFTDDEFPPNHDSLGQCERGYKPGAPPPEPGCCSAREYREVGAEVEWRRVKDLNWGDSLGERSHPIMIAEGIAPSDIKQGSLGNCWLLAALACLADHKGKITPALRSRVYNPRGKYTFRLADVEAGPGKFMDVSVDDFIPTMNDGHPIMARPSGPEMWVMLLEKVRQDTLLDEPRQAIAKSKYFGSYGAMEGGLLGFGMKLITGDEVFSWVQQHDGTGWRRHEVKPIGEGRKTCWLEDTQEDNVPGDQMFQNLTKWVKEGFVIGAGSSHAGHPSGIMPGHAYSVLQTYESKDRTIRLLNVRNPWGSFAWTGAPIWWLVTVLSTGAWSKDSASWNQNPEARKKLLVQDSSGAIPSQSNGASWVSWEDFTQMFETMDVCHSFKDVTELALEANEQDRVCGPCQGCFCGCAKFFLCCHGCRTLYCNKICPLDDRRHEMA